MEYSLPILGSGVIRIFLRLRGFFPTAEFAAPWTVIMWSRAWIKALQLGYNPHKVDKDRVSWPMIIHYNVLAGQSKALGQSLPVADHQLWWARRDFHGTSLTVPKLFVCCHCLNGKSLSCVALNLMAKLGIFKDFAVACWVKVPVCHPSSMPVDWLKRLLAVEIWLLMQCQYIVFDFRHHIINRFLGASDSSGNNVPLPGKRWLWIPDQEKYPDQEGLLH